MYYRIFIKQSFIFNHYIREYRKKQRCFAGKFHAMSGYNGCFAFIGKRRCEKEE